MKRFALATSALMTLAIAAPAFASNQLANALGVEGQGFSKAELIALKTAYDDDDASRINFLLENGGATAGVTASSKSAAGPGEQQLAESLGVNVANYSRAELVALKSALSDGDAARIDALRDQAADAHLDPSPAWAQLASSLGMNAATATPAELVYEVGERSED